MIVTTLGAVGAVAARLRSPQDRDPSTPTPVSDWEQYASAGQRIGPSSAAVQVVVFSDFQCPYCRAAEQDLQAIRKRHPNDVAIVYRHRPLPFHAYAMPAARAAVCAGRQQAFEAMHDGLFRLQDSLGKLTWARFAREAGIADTVAFNRCIQDTTRFAEIARDSTAAAQLHVDGTPRILINGLQFDGWPGTQVLEQAVSDVLRKKH